MNQQRLDFIKVIENPAQFVCRGTGLFPSVMIAQACLESNNGQSYLSSHFYNYFGIKAGSSWTGKTALMNTNEVVNGKTITVKASFRAYSDIISGFKDRVHLLQNVGTYARNGVFIAKSAEDQCHALLKAGYATDPDYDSKLIQLINIYNLKQYDLQA